MTVSTGSGEASILSSGNLAQSPMAETAPVKKKRSLPGMPDPEAEVISLSPRTLMATNRFICEICKKGFQRDQNLQLHRRGHNLPWKLRQRTTKEAPKRVYVCPEVSCVHHDPARALGDLTGIKKHFCRKHGEKKWQCEKCSKKYAVQSDWKAHSKICGTKEYRCFCGTLFSRRDSYITHRAFCDALAEETAMKLPSQTLMSKSEKIISEVVTEAQFVDSSSPSPSPMPDPAPAASPLVLVHNSDFAEISTPPDFEDTHPRTLTAATASTTCLNGIPTSTSANTSTITHGGLGGTIFASLFASSTANPALQTTPKFPSRPSAFLEPISLCLSSSNQTSVFERANKHFPVGPPVGPPPAMSATALLQKAAEMGVAATNSSLLRGFGVVSSSSSSCSSASSLFGQQREGFPWGESSGSGSGLNLELGIDDGPGLKGLVFGPTQTTLDLLGPSPTWMAPMGGGDLNVSGELAVKDEMMGRRRS